MKTPFLIDTDTASDDAVALIMALRSPHVDVLATAILVISLILLAVGTLYRRKRIDI